MSAKSYFVKFSENKYLNSPELGSGKVCAVKNNSTGEWLKEFDENDLVIENVISVCSSNCKECDYNPAERSCNGGNMVNGYYETVFADMISEGCISFKPVFYDPSRWYEIDTIADLRAAERVCSTQHHQPVIVTNHNRISEHNGASHLPSYERLDAIARIKRGPSRHPINTVSSSIMPTSTLPQ